MKSLEKQLSSSLGLSLILIFGLFWWVSITAIHKITEQYILTRLSHDTESIIKHLEFKDQRWQLNQEISPIYNQTHSGHYYIIKTPSDILVSDSMADFPLFTKNFKASFKESPGVYETAGPDNQLVLVLQTTFTKNQQMLKVWVAEDHSPIQKSLFTFDFIFGVFSLLIMGTIFGLQRFWLKRGFNQLKPLETALSNLQDDYRLNINIDDYPSEISVLIENLNLALNNAKAQLEKSRHANANLAHTLKTPLNLIYQLLDQPQLDSATQQQLKQQAQTIYSLLERELKKARIAAGSIQTKRLNAQHLNDLIQSLKSLYPHIQWQLDFNDPQVRLLALDQEDGYELFGNLLDNACKWAERQVSLKIEHTDLGTQVTIEDDGSGVAPEELSNIQKRGYRLDEQFTGHGLGLAIVADLMSAYEATIQFKNHQSPQNKGLCVTLFFNT